jgi:hypothetical protein
MQEELLREFQDFALTAPTAKSVMEHIAQRLHEKMTRYNWVGFYIVDPADSGILLVGPFVGSFTPNDTIYLVMRLYWPKETPPSILPPGSGTWQPPAIQVAQ